MTFLLEACGPGPSFEVWHSCRRLGGCGDHRLCLWHRSGVWDWKCYSGKLSATGVYLNELFPFVFTRAIHLEKNRSLLSFY